MSNEVGSVEPEMQKENATDTPIVAAETATNDFDNNPCRNHVIYASRSQSFSQSWRGLVDAFHPGQRSPINDNFSEEPKKKSRSLRDRIIPPGSIAGGTVSLSAFTIGLGCLGMPMVMQSSGVLIGSALLLLVGSISIFTATLLGIVADETGSSTMDEVGLKLSGLWLQRLTSAFMNFLCVGTGIIYTIALGTIMDPLRDIPGFPSVFLGNYGMKAMQTIVWATVIFPLSLAKTTGHLVISSFVAVVGIIFVALALIIHAGLSPRPRIENIPLFTFGFKTVLGFATCIFAFCFPPCTFGIYRELNDHRPVTLCKVGCFASLIAISLYIVVGVVGVYIFGSDVQGFIMANLRQDDPLQTWYIFAAFVGFFLLLILSFPLFMFPARDSLLVLFHLVIETDTEENPPFLMGNSSVTRRTHNLNRSTAFQRRSLSRNQNVNINVDYPLYPCPRHVQLFTSGWLALISLIFGLFVPNIEIMFGILGAFCGGMICIFLPAFFMLRLKKGVFTIEKEGVLIVIGTYIALAFGLFSVIFGTAISIYSSLFL